MRAPSEQAVRERLPQRYVSGWVPAEQVAPLLLLPVQSRVGETTVAGPLTSEQCTQVLDVLAATPLVRRQAAQAKELRLTPRRHGYFIALGPLDDAP